jgi:hypothetical protein
MKKILKHIAIWMGLLLFMSCDKFLDEKPDQKMTIPNNLTDCDALLDNYSEMNTMFPVSGETASDDLYLSDPTWMSLSIVSQRDTYIWESDVNVAYDEWQGPYKVILIANQVLEVLKTIDNRLDSDRFNRIKGTALFFRAYALSQLANVFTLPYHKTTANTTLGLPLRLSPDADYPSVRASLEETYGQIIADLKESVLLLPDASSYKSRPTKAGAYAAIARVALVISNFELAEKMADASLKLDNTLLDYNTIGIDLNPSFQKFNKEVLFDATTLTSEIIYPSVSRINNELYQSYDDDDLRKQVFFSINDDGLYSFKGQYSGDAYSSAFSGIAIDEVYLTLAEAYARNNKVPLAMKKLNELMVTRWNKDSFIPFTAGNSAEALRIILEERRKELVMRNIRWMDLRRLNQEPAYKKEITRVLNGKDYKLKPEDKRYAFLIPLEVMGHANLEQNPR